jgi:hypothetical protein
VVISKLTSYYLPILLCLGAPAFAQVNVWTQRYNDARTGANLSEIRLNTTNVSDVTQFGKLFSLTVDGSTQAQFLSVLNVAIPGKGTHDVVYVATMNDKLYAFDASSNTGANADPLWVVDFANPAAGITAVPIVDLTGSNSLNIVGNVGIAGTPVIDPGTGTMYLVARTKENGSYLQRLHAVDIQSGAERPGSPVEISASVQGAAGPVIFDPKIHNQRSSLALANGQVYIAWASHEDFGAYHGWVMTYDADTLAQTGVFCSTPNGKLGGIWQSGWAPAVDALGNVYYISGNGDWDGSSNFGESYLKFAPGSGLTLIDSFTPDNWAALNARDADLGSSGSIALPGTNLLAGGGKSGILYVLRRNGLGLEETGNVQIVQQLVTGGGQIKGGPIYWDRISSEGPSLFIWADNDLLKAYHFNGSTFDITPASQSAVRAVQGSSGGVLALSANGNAPGTGIIWASMPYNQNGDHGVVTGILRAFDATDLKREIWNSRMNLARDDSGTWPKFSPPLVVNGKVYLGSFSNRVSVYGLLPPGFMLAVSPAKSVVLPGDSAKYTVNIGAQGGFSDVVKLTVADLPAGASFSFDSSILTISTSASTPLGNYTVLVKAVSGALSQTVSVILTVSSLGPGRGAVSIDFVGTGVAMDPQEIAGVVPKAFWNSAAGAASDSPLALVDETGAATLATVSWMSDNGWKLPIADQPGDRRMMAGYLDTGSGNATTVTVAGLASNTYDVYVYADGDNGGSTRTGIYDIGGPAVSLTDPPSTNFNGVFTEANYLKVTFTGTGFTLTAAPGPASDNTRRAAVNGIQIVPSAP